MDYSNHIKFEGNLIKTKPTKITYSGFLFENGSDSVSIVYGYGSHWEHTTELKMDKTENGFSAEINMLNYNLFNCCFKNGNNEWDNNYGGNYVFEIEDLVIDPAFILNEDAITEILDNLFEVNLSEYTNSITKIEAPVQETVVAIEPIQAIEEFEISFEKNEAVSIEDSFVASTESTSLNQDIEKLFNDIYAPAIEEATAEQVVVEEISAEPVQDIAVEETTVEPIQDIVVEEPKVVEEKQSLLSDILADQATVQKVDKEEKQETIDFNMNSLIDEILSPIIKSSTFEQEDLGEEFSSIQQVNDAEVNNTIDTLISDIEKSVETKVTLNLIEEDSSSTQTIEEIDSVNFSDDEVSLIETLASEAREEASKGSQESTTALIEVPQPDENTFLVSARSLGKFYMFKKRVKLAFYKIVHTLPKLLSANLFEDDNN